MNDEISRPHTAILNVQVEIHSLTDSGSCSGHVVSKEVLQDYGLNQSFLISVSGIDLKDCMQKLKARLNRWIEP